MKYECDCGQRYSNLDALHACQNANHGIPRKPADVLGHALLEPDLDRAVRVIQDALGIKHGDVAGAEFSTRDRETYRKIYRADQRAEFLRSWLVAELFDAAHRAGQVQP